MRTLNRSALALAALATVALHVGVHALKWPEFGGWWAGFDQGAYRTAARAWAAGDLAPAPHLYPSGYALLAAPFVSLLPAQPFVVVDLASALLTLWLTVAIAGRLAPDWRWAPAAGAASFLVATAGSRAALAVWVVPWSTTPAAPLSLAALLCAVRYADRPRAREALGAGCAGCLVGAFRPADAAVLLAALGAGLAVSAVRARVPARRLLGEAGAFAAGVAVPAAALVGLHVLVHGWAPGAYVEGSARIGFDVGLIGRRWVLLVLDPRPVFGAGVGLAVAFPWVLPGLAGMLAAVLAGPERARHVVVVLAVAATWLLFLAYRDLHPPSLWRFYNYHYFKWTQPLLALHALLLLRLLWRPEARRAALGAVAAVLLLVPWRAGLERDDAGAAAVTRLPDGRAAVALPFALPSLSDGAVLGTTGVWDAVPGTAVAVADAGRDAPAAMTAGAYPVADGVLVLPVRRPPPGEVTLLFDPAVPVVAPARVTHVRVVVRLGVP